MPLRLVLTHDKTYTVYILSSAARVLYTGITNGPIRRMIEHKSKTNDGFTSNFIHCRLVYFEKHQYVNNAISREKQIKRWRREKKIWLIESINPNWHDLSDEWLKEPTSKAWPLDSALKRSARGDKMMGWEGKGPIVEKRKEMIEKIRRKAGKYAKQSINTDN